MNISRNPADKAFYKDLLNVFLVIGLFIIACIVFYYNSKDIKLKIALGGFGPRTMWRAKYIPRTFKRIFIPEH